MYPQIRAILWVQWRTLWTLRRGEGIAGRLLTGAAAFAWYGFWAFLAAAVAALLAGRDPAELRILLPWLLFLVFLYWQLAPILTANLGAALNLKKLLIYPIPERQLFAIDVLLRITTGLEVVLILAGLAAGRLRNPASGSPWVLLALPVFLAFNLFLAAGLRSALVRLAGYRWLREGLILLVVLAAALPQLLAMVQIPPAVRRVFSGGPLWVWPWAAAGRLSAGDPAPEAWLVLFAWMAGAYAFGRWQFRRSFEKLAAEPATAAARTGTVAERLYRVPGWFLPDPLATLVEKEIRSLFRSPRFRLVFFMGFTFGFLIWVPMMRGYGQAGRSLPEHLPVLISGYAVLLLSEVVFWNVFGFDRGAAQFYFAAPVPFRTVLTSKNLAAATVVAIEVMLVTAGCRLLGVPLGWGKVVETLAVLFVLGFYLIAAGNLSSLYYPRAVDPEQSWGRAMGGKFQLMMMLLVPVLGAPVLLAYAARYVVGSELAFYAVLTVVAVAGILFYLVATESALDAAEQKKEDLLAALSQGSGALGS
jgi:ABC-2 type transport system permease protein